MDTADLKAQLNGCRAHQYTRIGDLRPGSPYKVVKFERVYTRFGEAVTATLEGLVGDDYFLTVYIPQSFQGALSDDVISHYNSGEGERLCLQYRGDTGGIDFV